MDLFDVKRRDLTSFEEFLKYPEKAHEIHELKDGQKPRLLDKIQRKIRRHPIFSHQAFDYTYDGLGVKKGDPPMEFPQDKLPKKAEPEIHKAAKGDR